MADPTFPRRVIIRLPNWVGDVVHSLPALGAIRSHFGDAELTAVARGEVGTILCGCALVDHVVSYGSKPSLRGLLRATAGLRKGAFDLGIVLTNSFESALLFFLAGIKRRVGYATDRRQWLLSDPIDCTLSTRRLHQAEYYLAMLSQIGIPPGELTARLRLGRIERLKAQERLVEAGWSPGQRLFAFCPGAGSGGAKRWPIARFVSLAEKVAGSFGGKVIFLGGPTEGELGRIVYENRNGRFLNFIGQTTLREAMGLLSLCELTVGNDSGLIHLADALGVPALVLFGPTDPKRTAPRSRHSLVLQRGVDCSPCELHECPIDHRCMDELSVQEVYDGLSAFLGHRGVREQDRCRRGMFTPHS